MSCASQQLKPDNLSLLSAFKDSKIKTNQSILFFPIFLQKKNNLEKVSACHKQANKSLKICKTVSKTKPTRRWCSKKKFQKLYSAHKEKKTVLKTFHRPTKTKAKSC